MRPGVVGVRHVRPELLHRPSSTSSVASVALQVARRLDYRFSEEGYVALVDALVQDMFSANPEWAERKEKLRLAKQRRDTDIKSI